MLSIVDQYTDEKLLGVDLTGVGPCWWTITSEVTSFCEQMLYKWALSADPMCALTIAADKGVFRFTCWDA